jgi:hypothetical protein
LTRFELDQVYQKIIALADAQKSITDADLVTVVRQVRSAPRSPAAV